MGWCSAKTTTAPVGPRSPLAAAPTWSARCCRCGRAGWSRGAGCPRARSWRSGRAVRWTVPSRSLASRSRTTPQSCRWAWWVSDPHCRPASHRGVDRFLWAGRRVPRHLDDRLPAAGHARRRVHCRLARLPVGSARRPWSPAPARPAGRLAATDGAAAAPAHHRPPPTQERLDKLNQFVTDWLDRPDKFDFTIPATIPEAKQHFHEEFRLCLELLGSLGQQADATIVVPDTNVLVRSPDIGRYHQVLGTASYTVVLVAPVLAELDALKTGRASPSVRDRARGFSNRIKEWRRRGQLHVGVKVEGQVVVRAEGREPSREATLSWLHPTVVDDRIIACTLELQRRRPTDLVVLLTGDVNLLAKADLAGLPNGGAAR